MRKLLKKILKILGYRITKVSQISNSFDQIYLKRIKSSSPIIFDIGSHKGESIERFQKLFPESRIFGFEPNVENYNFLSFSFKDNDQIVIGNYGVGARNENQQFHIFKKSDTSSFLSIDEDSIWTKVRKEQFGIQNDESFLRETYEVEIICIDDFYHNNSLERIELLKIDTQGFELNVLKGCRHLLENQLIDFIELELIVHGPYSKELSFCEIESYLNQFDYKLYGVLHGSNYFDNPILQFDLLFTTKSLYTHNRK